MLLEQSKLLGLSKAKLRVRQDQSEKRAKQNPMQTASFSTLHDSAGRGVLADMAVGRDGSTPNAGGITRVSL